MLRTLTYGAVAIAAASLGLITAGQPASAATTKVPTQTLKAWNYNHYRATVTPTGVTIPRGSVKISATISVKHGSRYVARNVVAYHAAPGTYRVTSTFKYRTKTTSTTTLSRSAAATAESCRVTTATIVADRTTVDRTGLPVGEYDVRYTGTCEGYTADYSRHGSFTAAWTATEQAVVELPLQPDLAVGQPAYVPDMIGTITWSQKATTIRYSRIVTRTATRNAVVKKAYNSPAMTRTEYRAIRNGMTLSQVTAIVGGPGKVSSSWTIDGESNQYREWGTSSSWGSALILFTNGRVDSDWMFYYS